MRGLILATGLVVLSVAASRDVALADSGEEPNDTAGTATLAGKVGFALDGRVLPAGDADWYRFTVPSDAGSVTAQVTYDATTYDTSFALEIRDADGGAILATAGQAATEGTREVSLSPAAAGTYLIRVAHASGADLGDYSIRTTRDNDVDESNDTAPLALHAGSVGFTLGGRVLPEFDSDWYEFDVPEQGSVVHAEMTYDAEAYPAVPAVEIRSGSGSSVLALASGSGGRLTAVSGALAAGSYSLRVAHPGGADILDYSLRTWRANDADESNDTVASATDAGSLGFRRADRVLPFGDVDAWRFTVPAAVPSLSVEALFDRAAHDAAVTVELRRTDGTLVPTFLTEGETGPIRITAYSVAAGSYAAVLRHTGGEAVSSYSIQASAPMAASGPAAVATSAGAPLDVPLTVTGGIPPYTFEANTNFTVPAGLEFDGPNSRIRGTAAVAGRYVFLVACSDSGTPAHRADVLLTFDVNPALDVRVGEFLAFAAGRGASRPVPAAGGTAPFSFELLSGALPDGITFAGGPLAFAGVAPAVEADAAGLPVSFRVTDASGLEDTASALCVVCAPVGSVPIAAGEAASGVWFDAVRGSAVSAKVTTTRGAAKRPLRAVLLGADGSTPVAAPVRGGNGTATLGRFVVPSSGRWYLVLASDEGDASSVDVRVRVSAPASASGRIDAVGGSAPYEAPFGAIDGATVVLTAKPRGGEGRVPNVRTLVAPDGRHVPVPPAAVRTKGSTLTITMPLDASGTWTALFSNDGAVTGSIDWKARISQPRDATYDAGE